MGPEKLNGVGDMSLKVKERVSPEIINTKTIFWKSIWTLTTKVSWKSYINSYTHNLVKLP